MITPTADEKRIDMTGITAVFCAEKPDGKTIINYCSVNSDGDILVELTSQTLAVNGIIRCEIKLYQDSSVLSSCPFCIEVVKSVNDNGIESSDEYTILTELIKECRFFLESANFDSEIDYLSVFDATEIEVYTEDYEEESE